MKSRPNPLVRFSSLLTAAALAFAASAQAVDYTWDGGSNNWSATNWNGATASGPTTAGNTATINSGTVWANVGVGGVDSITVGVGGNLNFWNGAYQGVSNVILQGGTLGGYSSYNAYGASILGNLTVSGTAASTINGDSWFNLGSSTTFTVADATGDSASDLLVNLSLRSLPGSPDYTYLYNSKIIKEGAGTMEVTVHSYFNGGLDLNNGTLKLSGGNGGYGFFASAVNVNSGTTLSIASDGTGFGYQGGWKPASVNINGGTVTDTGGNHVWGISGGVNMTGGTLQSAGFQWNYTNLNTLASADTATVSGPLNLRGDSGYTGMAVDVAEGAAATDLLISGDITELYGSLGITKTGNGTMVLSGANSTYTGATVVSAGTLLVTGALGNSAVNVNGGAFGGTGTVGSSVTINSGLFHVADLFDPLAVSGTITLFSGFGVDDLAGLDWGSVSEGTYTLITGALGSGVFSGLSNNSLATAYNLGGGRSAYFQEGSLQLVVIPEPGAALLGGLGMLALLRRRR